MLWKTIVKLLQPAILLKVTFLHGCFLRFLNCANDTKSHRASHMIGTSTLTGLKASCMQKSTTLQTVGNGGAWDGERQSPRFLLNSIFY